MAAHSEPQVDRAQHRTPELACAQREAEHEAVHRRGSTLAAKREDTDVVQCLIATAAATVTSHTQTNYVAVLADDDQAAAPRCSSLTQEPKLAARVGGFQGMTNPCNCGPACGQTGRVRWGTGAGQAAHPHGSRTGRFHPAISLEPAGGVPSEAALLPGVAHGALHPAHAVNKSGAA